MFCEGPGVKGFVCSCSVREFQSSRSFLLLLPVIALLRASPQMPRKRRHLFSDPCFVHKSAKSLSSALTCLCTHTSYLLPVSLATANSIELILKELSALLQLDCAISIKVNIFIDILNYTFLNCIIFLPGSL